MRAVWPVTLGLALLALTPRLPAAADDSVGMSVVEQSPDDPPIETPSPKVKPSRNPALPPALGPVPAKVYVVLFCDYRSPECRRMVRAARQIPNEWPGDVRLEFRHVPGVHAWGQAAAVAALAAQQQGKFWEMHDCLFAHQETLDATTPDACAREVGLDLKKFAKDRTSPKLAERVRQDGELASRLRIHEVPAYTINGRLYIGWGTWELLRGAVNEERNQVDALLKSGKTLHQAQLIRTRKNVPHFPDALVTYATLVKHLQSDLATAPNP